MSDDSTLKPTRISKREVCKWLREHNASIKPKATSTVKDKQGYEYIGLDNGQIVHQRTAKRMGVL